MPKNLMLLVVLIFLSLHARGRKQGMEIIDSAIQQLKYMNCDTDRVNLLRYISYNCFLYEPDTGLHYGYEALRLAKKVNWPRGMANAYGSIAANYWNKSDYNNALRCYQSARDIFISIHDSSKIAQATSGLAIVNASQKNYDQSNEYFQQALATYRHLGDSAQAEGCLDNIGDNYLNQRQFPMALNYYGMALRIAKQIGNISAEAKICMNTGVVYNAMNRNDSTLAYYNKAKDCYRKINDEKGLADIQFDLAMLYFKTKQINNAILTSYRVLALARKLGDKYDEADIESLLGLLYATKMEGISKKGPSSKEINHLIDEHLDKAELIAKTIPPSLSVATIYNDISGAREKQGNYKAALSMFEKYTTMKDSLYNSEKDKEFTRLGLKYEFDKKEDSIKNVTKLANMQVISLRKEQEVLKLTQRQRTLYGVIAAIALLLGSFLVLFRNRAQQLKVQAELERERTEKKIRETEYEAKMKDVTFSALRAQMNPHFIFNCLNSIKLYTEQNNTAAASEYLTKFARLIRSTLDNARAEQTTLASEIEMLKLYLEMEAMRFKERLHYEIIVAEGIDTDFVEIPPLLIQPFVENALWHGIMPKPEGGKVCIAIAQSQQWDSLLISVTDDGIGREKAMAMKPATSGDHKSYGIKVSAERLALINEKYKTKAEINITDLHDEQGRASGTSVEIKIPIA